MAQYRLRQEVLAHAIHQVLGRLASAFQHPSLEVVCRLDVVARHDLVALAQHLRLDFDAQFLAFLDQQALVDHVSQNGLLAQAQLLFALGIGQGRVGEQFAPVLIQRALVFRPQNDPIVHLDDDLLKDDHVG